MMYGWSVTYCLPVSLTEPGSAATGTVRRPDTARRHAAEAGFREIGVLPVENDLLHSYTLCG